MGRTGARSPLPLILGKNEKKKKKKGRKAGPPS